MDKKDYIKKPKMIKCEDNDFGRVKVPKPKDLGIFTEFTKVSDFEKEKYLKKKMEHLNKLNKGIE